MNFYNVYKIDLSTIIFQIIKMKADVRKKRFLCHDESSEL